MLIYNSLSGKKEKFSISKSRVTRLFVCGPTVYDSSHIGHAKTYISFDVVARFLRYKGAEVVYVENVTNVDDRIIERGRKERKGPFAIAERYEKEFMKMMDALGVSSVDIYARASDYIPEIAEQVQTLRKKGYAYEIPRDGWYFDISKFKKYGELSRRTVSQAEDGISRIDENVKKRNRGDFCLFKYVEKGKTSKGKSPAVVGGEPAWKTEIGFGRPGWHIEDTAITEFFFGPQYDIHGGSMDLKFPHHEAEIAQQESASGKSPFVKYWMHTGFLLTQGEKMSKSKGNYISISDFLSDKPVENARILRFLILQTHYRSPIDYSPEIRAQAENSVNSLLLSLETLRFVAEHGKKGPAAEGRAAATAMKKKFMEEMENDFNTPGAIAGIFTGLNAVQKKAYGLPAPAAAALLEAAEELLGILGFSFPKAKIPGIALSLAKKRELYRQSKQFMQSDALREELHRLGYEVSDTPLGPFVRKI